MSLPRPIPLHFPRYRIVDGAGGDREAERAELLAQLRAASAAIPPRFFYDALGSALFRAICELPEYYPTRTERAIFSAHRHEIARSVGRGRQWVDLGAGDCAKGEAWIPVVAPTRYIAVDVARVAIEPALARMAATFPGIDFVGIVTDFTRGLDLRAQLDESAVVFFYPGSSIGNFAPDAARSFLAEIHLHCLGREGSGLLIGVDTKKDRARLEAAYDDALGVTAAFNRNVLNHVNAVLGSDFVPAVFAHRALYEPRAGRIEMHLEAMADLSVMLDGQPRRFAAGERIHTENSYKYSPAEFTVLLQDAGFPRVRCWQDAERDFAVFYAT